MFSVRPRFSVRRLAAASAFSAIALMLTVHPAAAQTTVIGSAPALGFTSNAIGFEDNGADTSNSLSGASSYSLGFEFTANSSVFVTSLGYFTDSTYTGANFVSLSPAQTGAPSYTESHDVGLYQIIAAAGTAPARVDKIASATVGNSSTRSGDFGYTQLTNPVALVAGGDYVLAGVSGTNDPYVYNVQDGADVSLAALTKDPAISYVQNRYGSSTSLIYPTLSDVGLGQGFFGPNFQISNTLPASAAPEPGQWSVLALAALGLGTLIVRVRRRQAAH